MTKSFSFSFLATPSANCSSLRVVGVVLEQSGGLESGERLAAAGGVPDIAVAAILVNAIRDGLDCVDLIRTHHHQLLLAGNQHHVAADHLTQGIWEGRPPQSCRDA